jgi:hypothetical protein
LETFINTIDIASSDGGYSSVILRLPSSKTNNTDDKDANFFVIDAFAAIALQFLFWGSSLSPPFLESAFADSMSGQITNENEIFTFIHYLDNNGVNDMMKKYAQHPR